MPPAVSHDRFLLLHPLPSVLLSLRRYFVLDPESGHLQYFVSEQGKSQKPRGSLPLIGASVTPSDEAPHMFVVNSNGELYKLRGMDIRPWSPVSDPQRIHTPRCLSGTKCPGRRGRPQRWWWWCCHRAVARRLKETFCVLCFG